MSWLRIDDGFTANKKIAELSDGEFRCWMRLLCHCARVQDPTITDAVIREVASVTKARVKRFAETCLIDEVEGGWVIHDWSVYNGRRDDALPDTDRERESKKRRLDLFRAPELRGSVRDRDGDHCRYCHVTVNWSDKRGLTGATYDHVDPDGGNDLANVVVACRSCNARKHKRTPEQAGMPLLHPYSNRDSDKDLGSLHVGAGATRDPHPHPHPHPPQAVTSLEDAAHHRDEGTASELQTPELLRAMP